MKFENKALKVSFEINDVLTVPMQLMYWGMVDEADGMSKFLQLWNGARVLVEKGTWKCEFLDDPLAALTEETDPYLTAVIVWVGKEVYKYITELEKVPND